MDVRNEFHFSLLENGLDFLDSSLDYLDAASETPSESGLRGNRKRNLKYALLHLCSSIELVFKERLRQEHWSLVFGDIDKANSGVYSSGTFQSVGFQEAQQRLSAICGIEFGDREVRRLRNLRERRNKVEHFGAVDTLEAVESNVSQMVSFLIDFVENSFDQEDLSAEEPLRKEIRAKLGRCRAAIQQRWKDIGGEEIVGVDEVECPSCHQTALSVGAHNVRCRFCNYSAEPNEAASAYLLDNFGHDRLEWPPLECPDCEEQNLVVMGRDAHSGYFCFSCGVKSELNELEECNYCQELYRPEGEMGNHICPGCLEYKMSKD